jgi:carboxylesterase
MEETDMRMWVGLVAAIALLGGCAAPSRFLETDLDSGLHPDAAVPLSVSRPHPTAAELARPVVVVTHGYSTTVWDMGPVIEGLEARGIQTSGVNLGGHGTSYADFASTTWKEWAAPLSAEFRALKRQGYQHVSILGHSTGCTLWLESIAEGQLAGTPETMVFLSPLIEFARMTRQIYYADWGPTLGVNAVQGNVRGTSVGHQYRYRPISAMQTLASVTKRVRHRLAWGMPVNASSRVLIVQGDDDDVVDPAGARLLAKGLIGPKTTLMMVRSGLHNPMGPEGMAGHTFTAEETALKTRLIGAIGDAILDGSSR